MGGVEQGRRRQKRKNVRIKGEGKAAWVGKSSVGMGRGRSNFDNNYYLRTLFYQWRKKGRVNRREGEH